MKSWIALSCFLTLVAVVGVARTANTRDRGSRLAHIVFFELEDASEASIDALIADCKKYLSRTRGDPVVLRRSPRARDGP